MFTGGCSAEGGMEKQFVFTGGCSAEGGMEKQVFCSLQVVVQ